MAHSTELHPHVVWVKLIGPHCRMYLERTTCGLIMWHGLQRHGGLEWRMEWRSGWALQILTLFVIFHRWRAFRGHLLDLSSAVLSGLHGTELMLLLIDPRKWETTIILRLSRGCHSNYRRQTQWGTAIYSRLRKAEFIKWAATHRGRCSQCCSHDPHL